MVGRKMAQSSLRRNWRSRFPLLRSETRSAAHRCSGINRFRTRRGELCVDSAPPPPAGPSRPLRCDRYREHDLRDRPGMVLLSKGPHGFWRQRNARTPALAPARPSRRFGSQSRQSRRAHRVHRKRLRCFQCSPVITITQIHSPKRSAQKTRSTSQSLGAALTSA